MEEEEEERPKKMVMAMNAPARSWDRAGCFHLLPPGTGPRAAAEPEHKHFGVLSDPCSLPQASSSLPPATNVQCRFLGSARTMPPLFSDDRRSESGLLTGACHTAEEGTRALWVGEAPRRRVTRPSDGRLMYAPARRGP